MLVGHYRIEQLTAEKDAASIASFLLSGDSFDDTRYTPGELEQFCQLPYRALKQELVLWYAVNESGDIIAVNSIMENDQRTGGYNWDYIVVHRSYRKSGIASVLIGAMFDFLHASGARYLLTYTCDLPPYQSIRRLFDRNGFKLIGRCPDYYFEGEDRLIYYRSMIETLPAGKRTNDGG